MSVNLQDPAVPPLLSFIPSRNTFEYVLIHMNGLLKLILHPLAVLTLRAGRAKRMLALVSTLRCEAGGSPAELAEGSLSAG